MRVAIYARVSTDDKGQDPENQPTQLTRMVCKHSRLNALTTFSSWPRTDQDPRR
jgi:predicted site-specific integrase-resolvase